MMSHLRLMARAGRRAVSSGRYLSAALAVIGLAVVLALSPTVYVSTRLLATYLLKPTQVVIRYPDSFVRDIATPYLEAVVGNPPTPVSVIDYPASLFPLSPGYVFDPTFDQSVAAGVVALTRDTDGDPAPVIFGYSQGATVATEYKRNLNAGIISDPTGGVPDVRFVLIGNPNRPNGGVLSRFTGLYIPFFDITANGPTPTETAGAQPGVVTTDDFARQYDFFADYPTNPLNLISLANAIAGLLTHADYITVGPQDAVLQDQYGDTRYYLIPTERLPLLAPLALIVPSPILTAIDAPLRVLVEAGYDRTISPGVPTSAQLGYAPELDQLAVNFLRAVPTGWDDALSEIGLGRPFGTVAAGPYGVGGPPVTLPNSTAPQLVSEAAPIETADAAAAAPSTRSADQPDTTRASVGPSADDVPSPTTSGSTAVTERRIPRTAANRPIREAISDVADASRTAGGIISGFGPRRSTAGRPDRDDMAHSSVDSTPHATERRTRDGGPESNAEGKNAEGNKEATASNAA